MNLLIVAALAAVCGAAKLDRTYLPPASARTAGGSPGALQAPNSLSQNAAPKGSYTNDFQGVVVDAALAGTRGASGSEETGLGAPRNSYGSTASKVGDAAFRGAQAGFRFPQGFGPAPQFGPQDPDQFEPRESGQSRPEIDSNPERPQAAQERAANTLRFDSEVGAETFNFAFETDNGISAEETGTATNGVQAQGGYSYTGDDGKVYTVTYTADEGGYQPRGDHLPTPPPIPEEILKSLEQNARDEANGVVDDGLYDAQKYNAGSDYAESDSTNGKQNGGPSANTGNTDVDASGTFINQNIQNQPFNPNNRGSDKPVTQFSGVQTNANRFGSRNDYLPPFQNQRQQANAVNSDTDSSSSFQQESTDGSGDVHSQTQQQQPTSQTFGSRPTSNNQFNGFKQSNGNQFNQNGNRFPSQTKQQFGSASNGAPQNSRNQFSAQASASFNSQHATSVPDTELTTPFETNPQDAQSAQSSAPSTNTFGLNNQPSHNEQSQFASHNSHLQTSQAPVQPTIPTFPQSRPQSSNNRPSAGNRNTQTAFPTQAPHQQEQFTQQAFGSKRPQFSQPQFSQNADNQFSSSTQRPQFAQQATAQDDSYYYNQPSRAFNTPQSQSSRFPSASSNQFDRVTQQPFSSQITQEEENYPSTPFPSQNGQHSIGGQINSFGQPVQGQRQGPSRRPSFPTQSTPSDNQFQSNAFASVTNGITQASASSFAAPTSVPNFNGQHSSQTRQQFQQTSFQSSRPSSPEPSKPSFGAQTTAQVQTTGAQSSQFEKQNFEAAKPLSQQPLQDVKQVKLDDDTKPDAPVTNLQYTGEVYEYTKPAEMLPPPEDGFGQFGTKMPSAQKPAQPRPQFGQSTSAQATAQTFAPQPTQFTQSGNSQQSNQFGSRPQFGQSTASAQATSKPFAPQTQLNQGSKASQSNQFGSRPQFGQSTASSQQTTSDSFAPQPTQNSQFGSRPQFGQATQSQQSTFGSKPQFSQASQTQEQSMDKIDAKPTRPQFNQQAEQHSQFNNQRRPNSQSQGAAESPKPFSQNGNKCCQGSFGQQTSFGGRPSQGDSSIASSFQSNAAFNPAQSQSVAGKGEVFGGPRAPPSFDETGYHY